ncbi:MAG TPA: outer membrane beta-barrel protein [Steroidobacteraceae bacterium]|nr:outer membrane beta-barrel protein [Steroidobacteraceae bacterium]
MRKYVALGVIAAMALGAQTAAAEGFSYNLIEGSYATGDVEGFDLDGFGVKGSWELAPSIFVFGGLQNLDFDGGGSLDALNLGVGMNWALSDNADLFGGASFERLKSGSSESGFGVQAGVRGRVVERLELSAAIKYSDIGDFGDSFTYTAGGRWYFTPNFALGLDYNKLDLGDSNADGDLFSVALRYDFGG